MKQATALWLWRIPDNFPQKMIGNYKREVSPNRFLFCKGESVSSLMDIPKFVFQAPTSELKKFDVLPNNSSSPLVSTQVAEILQTCCKRHLQFIETEVQTSDGLLETYKLLNIAKTVSCINHEKSSYSLISGTNSIRGFRKLVCKLEGVESNLLAREKEYTSHIIVANDIFELFSFHKLSGVSFEPCEVG